MRTVEPGRKEGPGRQVPDDRSGWSPDPTRPDRESMRPDHEFAVAGGYLAAFAGLFLGGLLGAVLGGVIGSNLGSWLGGRAGDAAQAAGRVCLSGFLDMVYVVDCGDSYASAYALRFGLVGVLVGLVIGLVVGTRLGRRIVDDAGKPQREATWFTWAPRPTHTCGRCS